MKKTKQVVSTLSKIYQRPAPCISSLVQQSIVKILPRLSENYLIIQSLINKSIMTKTTVYFEDQGGLTERMNKNLIVCHSLIFISSVDVPLDFRHSHLLYPRSQVLCWINSVFYISDCVTIFYFLDSFVVHQCSMTGFH